MGSCLSCDGRGGGGGGGGGRGSGDEPPLQGWRSKKGTRGWRRRRQGFSSNSTFESNPAEDRLHRIPGRMFLNGASSVACICSRQGNKGANQDAMIVWENFGSQTGTVFCGVFDGHGPDGHMVSRKVRDSLPLKLSAHWGGEFRQNSISSTTGSMTSKKALSICLEDKASASTNFGKEKLPDFFATMKESFLKAFKTTDKELKSHPYIDCFCSGTTAVTILKQSQYLMIGNVGDSRAVLGTRDHDGNLVAIQLTTDLKPNLPREAERFKRYSSRIFALRHEPEVARVWLPNNDSPGLAMTRAFGDFCLKDFGLISVPEISYRRITEKDEFIILATDGIWDVLSNKEAVDIVASSPARSFAARSVVEHAVRAWRFKCPTSSADDCTAVCLFLD